MDTGERIREAGWNRAQKLLRSGRLEKLWLASDAERPFAERVRAEAAKAGISPDQSKTGDQLAVMAGVKVFTAVLSEYSGPADRKGQKREAKNGENP